MFRRNISFFILNIMAKPYNNLRSKFHMLHIFHCAGNFTPPQAEFHLN